MTKKLKKRVFFLIYCGAFLLPLAFFIPAGAVNSGWVKLLGTAAHDLGRDITVDSADNIYVTGYTEGFLDGEVNTGGYDIFLAKYDTNGNRLWTQLLGTTFRDDGYGVATDSTGNIYITGRTNGNLDGEVNTGGYDIFLVKYDTNGSRLWTRLLGTALAECGYGIVVDSTDNVFVTGSTEGDLDGLPNAGGSDSFLVKYDTNGNRLWTQLLGTAFDDQGRRVAADSTGNIYVTGSTEGDLDGLPNAGGSDSFLVKYDTNGNR
ncbi:MAG TPA: hypothetical protein ENO00_00890, partial [Deltaproteobacteria bacterium]|nr:hypothetical protein [Deltaproteobacteria bacterium]